MVPRRRIGTATGIVALGLVVLAGLAATPAPAASTVAKHSLTSNIQLTTTRIPKKPVEERVLRVTPSTTSVPDIVPASSVYPMFDLTSTMSAHAGALAAINGDFGTTKDQPTHTLMIDGELWTTDRLIAAGAWTAVNLDGGGSTSMWVKKTDASYCQSYPSVGGCLVMRPSQSFGERGTRSAIAVLPTADTGAPSALR